MIKRICKCLNKIIKEDLKRFVLLHIQILLVGLDSLIIQLSFEEYSILLSKAIIRIPVNKNFHISRHLYITEQ